jgi:hypothetical protein|tara:strand:+ start:916 stop:1389 length:474 start_codon:yes stop_codon:yes gene_type:complete
LFKKGSQKIEGKNMKFFIVLFSSLILISGCSTLTGSGTAQSISVETVEGTSGDRIIDARCDLSNDEGSWTVLTPGSVMVHRSNKPLSVKCQKSGYIQDYSSVDSKTKANMWGNIILGGGIGAIIDHNNGSAYDYPAVVRIPMRREASSVEEESSALK